TDPRYQGSEDQEHAGVQPHLLDEPKVGLQREVRVHRPEPFEVVTGNAQAAWARACSVRPVQISIGQPLRCRGGAGPRESKVPEAEEEGGATGGDSDSGEEEVSEGSDKAEEPCKEPTAEEAAVTVIPNKYRYYPPAQLLSAGKVYLDHHIALMERNFQTSPDDAALGEHRGPGWLRTPRWSQLKADELEAYVL
ncbi:hypothetical protein KFL_016930010, partial [Klebsormidium nitens]